MQKLHHLKGLDNRGSCKITLLKRPVSKRAVGQSWWSLMRSGNYERVRGTAAQALLDRGWGKPKVEVVSDEAGDVQVLMAVAAKLDERRINKLV